MQEDINGKIWGFFGDWLTEELLYEEHHRLGDLSNLQFFFTDLGAGKSEIEVPGGGHFSQFLCLHMVERELSFVYLF